MSDLKKEYSEENDEQQMILRQLNEKVIDEFTEGLHGSLNKFVRRNSFDRTKDMEKTWREKSCLIVEFLNAMKKSEVTGLQLAEEKVLLRSDWVDHEKLFLATLVTEQMSKSSSVVLDWLRSSSIATDIETLIKKQWYFSSRLKPAHSLVDVMIIQSLGGDRLSNIEHLIDQGLCTNDRALYFSCEGYHTEAIYHWMQKMVDSGETPSAKALSGIASHFAPLNGRAHAQDFSQSHFTPYLQEWKKNWSDKDKQLMWRAAINHDSAFMLSLLIAEKIEINPAKINAKLFDQSQHLLDYAIVNLQGRADSGGIGNTQLMETLLSMSLLKDRKSTVSPSVFEQFSNQSLEYLLSKDVNIYNVDENGNNFLHLWVAKGQYHSPNKQFYGACAKRFPAILTTKNKAGKSVMDTMDDKLKKEIEKSIVVGEFKDIKKITASIEVHKTIKPRVRSL